MKEDDMDEMMRKAAKNYEIDAGKVADWNAVHNAVHIAEDNKPPETKKKKRIFPFWWLLLIPLGWIANVQYNKFNALKNKTGTEAVDSAQAKTGEVKKSSPANSLPGNIDNSTGVQDRDAATNSGNVYQFKLDHNRAKTDNSQRTEPYDNLSHANTSSQAPAKVESNGPQTNASPAMNNAGSTDAIQPSGTAGQNNLLLNNDTAAVSNNASKTTASSIIRKHNTNDHYFYAGLIAGADFSFVKFQNMQPVGYNAGLLIGYKFRKLSIESGLYIAKKNYYTDGEYFDKSSIPFFNDAEILSVNGYCNMFEIPLNIKYDIIAKGRHTWFATAGLSSYLMHKEFYNYDYIKDGQQFQGSRPYYHTTQNWFSVLNVSTGYQLQTGLKTYIRIEPYYKRTLTGVGTGSLSISSLGINAGIARRIP
jgi:hypothetical protein